MCIRDRIVGYKYITIGGLVDPKSDKPNSRSTARMKSKYNI